MSATRPSVPPPAPSVLRPRALPLSASRTAAAFRAGEGPRRLAPARAEARSVGAAALQAASTTASAGEVASWFGARADRTGAELLSGKAVVTAGELAMLPPFDVASGAMLSLLVRRLDLELARTDLTLDVRCLIEAQHRMVAGALALARRRSA